MSETVLELARIGKPLYATAKGVRELFGMPEGVLRTLARHGRVRARKLGTSQGHTCLYRVADLVEWVEGEEPIDELEE